MRRKKGFTLVELLVAMVCATLVLAMVSSAAVFLSRMSDGALKESQTYFQLQTLKTFIQQDLADNWGNYYTIETTSDSKVGSTTNQAVDSDGTSTNTTTADKDAIQVAINERYKVDSDGTVTYTASDGTTMMVIKNDSIEKIVFDVNIDTTDTTIIIVKCTVTYDGGQAFTFVAYSSNETTSNG